MSVLDFLCAANQFLPEGYRLGFQGTIPLIMKWGPYSVQVDVEVALTEDGFELLEESEVIVARIETKLRTVYPELFTDEDAGDEG